MFTFISRFGWYVTGEIVGYNWDANGAYCMQILTDRGYHWSAPVSDLTVEVA